MPKGKVLPRSCATYNLVFALVISFVPLSPAIADIAHVPLDHGTIQTAIDAVADGDTILVASGSYQENINFRGKEIVVSSHFMLDQDPQFILTTIIDGSNPDHPDTGSTVLIPCDAGDPDRAPVFQGFTVIGGNGTIMLDHAEGYYWRHGGGIATDNGSPHIQFNYIHSNGLGATQNFGGGGIHCQSGSPTINNNVIVNNRAWWGCGINVSYSNVEIRNNVVAHNFGGEQWSGGGIYQYQGTMECVNNTVVFNTSTLEGGGIKIASGSATILNSIIRGNEAPSDPQVYLSSASAVVQFSNIQGGWPGFQIMDVEPMLSEPWFYTLAGSPCIDAGSDETAHNDISATSDPFAARWPSRGTRRNDMGAYGGPGCYPFELVAIDTDSTVGWPILDIDFDAESYFEAEKWVWYFGDGDTAVGMNCSHIYEDPGIYDVAVTVEHDGGEVYTRYANSLVVVLADSLLGEQAVSHSLSETVELTIEAVTSIPIHEITIPIEYAGDLDLQYDSVSTAGCRTTNFESVEVIDFNSISKQLTVKLANPPYGAFLMPAGSGPVLKVYFSHNSGNTYDDTSPIMLDGYSGFMPMFHGPALEYTPIASAGSITYLCDCGFPGDMDCGESMDPVDVVYLVNLVYRQLDALCAASDCPFPVGDLDCNEEVNPVDVVYLVNAVYKSLDAICDGCAP